MKVTQTKIPNWKKILLPIMVAFFLSGCMSSELRHHAMSYNVALEDVQNQTILMNAVRASKRYPMHFSRMNNATTNANVSGSLNANFSFSPHKLTNWSLIPSVAGKRGISSFDTHNLHNQNYITNVLKTLPIRVLKVYMDRGWSLEVLLPLLIGDYVLDSKTYHEIEYNYNQFCNKGVRLSGSRLAKCGAIARAEQSCSKINPKKFIRRGKTKYIYNIINNPAKPCSYSKFMAFSRKLMLLNPRLKEVKGPSKGDLSIFDDDSTYELVIKDFRDELIAIPLFGNQGNRIVNFRMRSIQRIIYYLGQLIRAQHNLEQPFMPSILVSGGRFEVPLFEVRRGLDIGQKAAVRIRHEREIFIIPRTEIGDPEAHRSMSALALVTQLSAHLVTPNSIPSSPQRVLNVGGN